MCPLLSSPPPLGQGCLQGASVRPLWAQRLPKGGMISGAKASKAQRGPLRLWKHHLRVLSK